MFFLLLLLGCEKEVLQEQVLCKKMIMDAFGIYCADLIQGQGRVLWSGTQARGDSEELKVVQKQPGDPAKLALVVGEKSVIAGGDRNMAAVIVTDKYGNLVSEKNIRFHVSGLLHDIYAVTRHGIAYSWLYAGKKAGMQYASASWETLQSARALFRIVADLRSASIHLNSATFYPVLPSIARKLETKIIKDQFGNIVEDGIYTLFMAKSKQGGVTLAPTVTTQGIAAATLLGNELEDQHLIQAILEKNVSLSQALKFQPIRLSSQAGIFISPLQSEGAYHVKIGPLTTSMGHLFMDGESIHLTVHQDKDSFSLTGYCKNGFLEQDMVLPSPPWVVRVKTRIGELTAHVRLNSRQELRTPENASGTKKLE